MNRRTTAMLEQLRVRLDESSGELQVFGGSETQDKKSNNRSSHPTVVELGMQQLRKSKNPKLAAKVVARKYGGHPNMFLSSPVDPVLIVPEELEEQIWKRITDFAIQGVRSFKAGKEHFALDSALLTLGMTDVGKPSDKKLRAELKKRVIASLGHDPFTSDS